ncbi:MAG: hypothetical protein LIO71_02920 [Ruminococcus sp.]|nr:hypothetical protein [Ruminococcus sp.]
MALEWIDAPWAKDEKEAFEWLDNNVDATEFIHDYYESAEDIISDIVHYHPEAEQYLSRISDEEFVEYLEDRYDVDYHEETITTYWIKK